MKLGKVISVINMKGGVGKTTLTKELGYFMANEKGKKVLFIDLDPQSNLTQTFFLSYRLRHTEDLNIPSKNLKVVTQSIQDLFESSSIKKLEVNEIVLPLLSDNGNKFYLIPGTLSTIFLERSSNTSNMEKSIYNFIEENDLREKFDYILIDCPPTYSVYTIAALLPSDYYLVPVEPGIYSVLGINMLEKVVDAIVEPNKVFFKDRLIKNLGIVFTKYTKESTDLVEMIEGTSALKEMYFFENKFLYSKKLIDRPSYFISDYADGRLRNNIKKIFNELEERINES